MIEHTSFDKLVGTTLGNYRLEQIVEQNPLGPIFHANTNEAGKTYLVRFLLPPADISAEARIISLGRFQKEANLVAELQHPNILPLLDYGNSQGTPYLVFSQIAAHSLTRQLGQSGALDVRTTSRYLDMIATALEYAHQKAILHRNLTTDCILVEPNGNLLISDFGVMRMVDLFTQDTKESARAYAGEVSEGMAPEQLLNKTVGTFTDVYALGAVLYRMLTGHRVFRGKTREEMRQQHLQAAVPSLRTWRNDLPPALDSVIATAMAKDPVQRFQQPGMLANAYAQMIAPNDPTRQAIVAAPPPAVDPQPVGARLIAPPLPQSGPPSKRTTGAAISRRQALTLIAVGGGVVVVAGAALFGSRFLPGTTSSPAANTGNSAPTASTGGSQPTAPSTTQAPTQQVPVLAHTSDVPLNSAKTFTVSGGDPGVLVHLPNDQFVAFDAVCTHTGCTVAYNPQSKLLECPCHGAVFDPSKGAAVVAGPAPSPLSAVTIKVNSDGTITTG